MTFRKSSSEIYVMPHLSAVAFSSRGSTFATGCFDCSIVGRLRLWVSWQALGLLLIILRCEIFSPLRSAVELCAFVVSGPTHFRANCKTTRFNDATYGMHQRTYGSIGRAHGIPPSDSNRSGYNKESSTEPEVAYISDGVVSWSAG
jgi:hypothetical protein